MLSQDPQHIIVVNNPKLADESFNLVHKFLHHDFYLTLTFSGHPCGQHMLLYFGFGGLRGRSAMFFQPPVKLYLFIQ